MQELLARERHDRFRVKLHALDRAVPVTHRHDLAVRRPRCDLERFGARALVDDERVIAGRFEGRVDVTKDAPAVVLHEVYMQDPQRPGEWPRWFLLADGLKDGKRNNEFTLVMAGENPFRTAFPGSAR